MSGLADAPAADKNIENAHSAHLQRCGINVLPVLCYHFLNELPRLQDGQQSLGLPEPGKEAKGVIVSFVSEQTPACSSLLRSTHSAE